MLKMASEMELMMFLSITFPLPEATCEMIAGRSSFITIGTLEGCVLAIISREETYGYEISEQLREHGFGRITEGTIYPLLLRLEKNGQIAATYSL